MLPPAVEEAIRRIRDDRTSGASKLARLSLDVMGLAISEANGHSNREELAEAARRLSEAQPAMAIVHNVAHLIAQLVEEGQDPQAVLDQVRSELDSARGGIARTFQKIAPAHATIVTLSDSENVREALALAQRRAGVDRAYVMESRPLFEGRTLAKALADAGVPTTVVPDSLGPSLMAEASCALVGADSVLRDGAVVNKVGTYPLALGAQDHKKPFYVACEALKFDARYDGSSWPGSPPRDPKEVWDTPAERAEAMNRYFDVTPGRLVTLVVTERGSYAPDVIRTMLSPGRERGR